MDLRFLKSLVAVVEQGSIAAAAQREGITAPAISQRLQALEAELGVDLLRRAGRSVQPTPACLRLLPQIRRVLEEGQALTLSLSQTTQAGRFRLGAISTVLTDYMPRIIRQVHQQMPAVELDIHPGTSAQLYRVFQDGELDAVICVAPPFPLPKSQRFTGLVREPVGVIGSADRDAPFIVYSRKSWGGALCWRGVQQVNETPQILCELDALETIAIMVQAGSGVAVVPNWAGLTDRFPDMAFKRIGNDARGIGLLYRTHQADHPVLALIRGAIV